MGQHVQGAYRRYRTGRRRETHTSAGHRAGWALIGAGADPYDLQALYNSSIVDDDIFWTDLLRRHCEHQGRSMLWSHTESRSLGGRFKVGTLNYLLGNAVGQNQLKRATWLLDHGADATTIHAYSGQQVHTTARLSGCLEMASLLERHGAVAEKLSGALAFQAALMRGDEAEVRALAARNPAMLSSSAALLSVAAAGQADAARPLLDLGVRVDGVDHDGISPLHRAAQAGSMATVEVLLAAGADVNLREFKWQGTPLSWAIVLKQPLVANRLAEISRDVRALAVSGRTERLETVLREDASLANQTLTRVDDPTPLFCLPDDEDLAATVARILLAFGANRSVKDDKGRTPAEAARFRGLDEAAELLAPP